MTVAGDIETFPMAVCPNGSCGSISESNRRKGTSGERAHACMGPSVYLCGRDWLMESDGECMTDDSMTSSLDLLPTVHSYMVRGEDRHNTRHSFLCEPLSSGGSEIPSSFS